uniref:Uncharacterized protein n=1 Tax=Anguilla anguilla TaxID=7936 RepID=A0A0E9X4P8_ANGAN
MQSNSSTTLYTSVKKFCPDFYKTVCSSLKILTVKTEVSLGIPKCCILGHNIT